ncbi:unnamed protein product [Rangifer tarandus platyrhynchus]|uniref:Uncharacterized protein n=1 Tax=Rangifer tarandus platyrhynchus TaxID=3082113 RepID=A0AC59Z8H6_RANTA
MAAVVQIAINPQMPRISHPLNRLDRQSNLVSNQEASLARGPSSQGRWRFTGNHKFFFFFLTSKILYLQYILLGKKKKCFLKAHVEVFLINLLKKIQFYKQ